MPAECLNNYSCTNTITNLVEAWNFYYPELQFNSLLVILMTIVGIRLIIRSESLGIIVPFYFGFILIFALGSLITTADLNQLFSINNIILLVAVFVSGVALFRSIKLVGG